MVTLVQQQQTPDDSHQCQGEKQERADGAVVPAEHHVVDFPRGSEEEAVEVARRAKETALVVPGNDSVGGSSTQCSDVDDDDDDDVEDEGENEEEEKEESNDEEQEDEGGGWIANLPMPSPTAIFQQQQATANGNIILPNADPSNFGDVCVKNSTNVHLGNKTFYKGPVTIKQFVYTNPALVQDESNLETAGQAADVNASDLSANKVDAAANGPILQQNPELYKVTQWLWTWRCAAFMCILALILVTAVVVSSLYLTHRTDAPIAPVFPEIPDSSVEGVTVSSVRFVTRSEWGAQPPADPLTKLKLPVPYVIISHTVTDFCTTQSECTMHVRFAQTFHIESRGWSDIAYNFLVGGDGLAYVGRSWDYIGAHSFGFNNRSIGISFIGTFNSVIPPKAQLHAAQKIIEIGVMAGKIAPDYKLLGHRQVSKTLSPGDALYSILKTWPHWAPSP